MCALPATQESYEDHGLRWTQAKLVETLSVPQTKIKWVWGITQVVEYLARKHKALSSSPNNEKENDTENVICCTKTLVTLYYVTTNSMDIKQKKHMQVSVFASYSL
jgi:hypothetical protein